MPRTKNAIVNRIHVRAWLLAPLVGCFSLTSAFAADVPIPYNPNSVEYQKLSQVGQWQQLTGALPGQGGRVVFQPNSAATTVSPKVSDLRLSQAGSGVNVNGKVNLPIGGAKTIPVNVAAAISKNALIAGLGLAVSNPLVGIGIAIAAPALMDWLSREKIGINPDQSDPQKPFTQETEILDCVPLADPGWPDGSPDRYSYTWISLRYNETKCIWGWNYTFDGGPLQWKGWAYSDFRGVGGQRRPITVPEAQSAMNTDRSPLTPEAVEQAAKSGVDPFGAQGPQVTASGPTSVPGEKTTTTESIRLKPGTNIPAVPGELSDSGTKTTTTTNTTNVQYSGNTVSTSTTNNTTTNITNNVTNTTINEGTKVQETTNDDDVSKPEEPPKEETLCEKYPDILACAKPELDAPEGEIPKTTREVTLTEENLFSGGSCPADVYFTPHGLQQLKVWDWNQSCGYITGYVKPILLICCTFAAFMILIPGRTE